MRRQTGPWRRVTKFVPYILIGMDILKDFDFRCGESEWNGEHLFLGCLKENINSDYLNELQGDDRKGTIDDASKCNG